MINKLIYRLLLLVMDIRLPFFDQIRSDCVRRLTKSPNGSDLIVMSGVFFEGFQSISLGRGISFNQDCFISGYGGLIIGNEVSIGHRVSILTTEHLYDDPITPIRRQQSDRKPVTIGNNVWIGANVTILAGVEIPDGCIIGAGAVVTKKLDNINGIYVGNPARFIKSRF
ncbi:MAG: acyltransferase [Gallionellaceae bacterium]|nr:acyltransferase [Gallionellaceae bacterium]